MRVLHVLPSISLEHGGPAHAVRAMATAAVERGMHVEIAATTRTYQYETLELAEQQKRVTEFEENGVRFHLFPERHGLSVPLTRWLVANTARFDVLHIHVPFAYSTLAACAVARAKRVPYVYRTIGTLDPWCFAQKAWKKRPYYRMFIERELRNAASIHVTSEAERQALAGLGFEARVEVIPVGVELPPLQNRSAEGRSTRLLFLGRLDPIKALPVLLEAVAALLRGDHEVVLQVAGVGTAAYRRELEANVRRLGLGDRVQFLGFVRGEAKIRLLAESDVFVLPSFHESFGVAVVEAMAAGMPAVVSDHVALASEIDQARAGAVARAGDVDSLVRALEQMLDPSVRLESAQRARELVESRFTFDAMGRALDRVYRQIARTGFTRTFGPETVSGT